MARDFAIANGDLCIANFGEYNDISLTDSITPAVTLSLLLDARSNDANIPPAERKGWWGGNIGSLLWTFQRQIINDTTAYDVRIAAEESLQWLIAAGEANSIEVSAIREGREKIKLSATIHLSDRAETIEIEV